MYIIVPIPFEINGEGREDYIRFAPYTWIHTCEKYEDRLEAAARLIEANRTEPKTIYIMLQYNESRISKCL